MDEVGDRMTPIWLEPMTRWEDFHSIKDSVFKGGMMTALWGLGEAQKCHMLSSMLYPLERSCLYITGSDAQARRIQEDLSFFYPGKVMYFPEREVLLYDMAARSMEIDEQRIRALEALVFNNKIIVVASVEAVLSLQTPVQVFKDNLLTVNTGDVVPLTQIVKKTGRNGV